MKYVVIGESASATREAIMAVYPRHKQLVDKFIAQGVVLGIGPFGDGGNMARRCFKGVTKHIWRQ